MRKVQHHIRLLKKLNPYKVYNAIRIYRSYKKSLRKGSPVMKGLPYSISIEPTTSCNLRCPECPSGLRSFSRATGMLDPDVFSQMIEEMKHHLIWLTFYFQGEPYLHPQFLQLVHMAENAGIYTSTSTNAHYLTDEKAEETVKSGLSRLIISIDGITQEAYQDYRVGGKLAKVIEGTKAVVRAKKKWKTHHPEIVFQFLVTGQNEHQIDDLHALAKDLGVDQVHLKTIQIYDYENGSPLIPQNENYSRYRKNASGKYILKNKLLNQCWRMWHSCVITWDGKVVPCCFDKDAKHVLGQMQGDKFETIWNSQAYNKFRNQLLTSRSQIDICANCTEGTKVYLEPE